MRLQTIGIAAVLAVTVTAQAEEGFFQRGVVTRMHTAKCTFIPAGGFHLSVAILGAPDPRMGMAQAMCPEYLVEAGDVHYRVRPVRADVLLTLGSRIDFKLRKGRMILRPEDSKRVYKFEIYEMQSRAEMLKVEAAQLQIKAGRQDTSKQDGSQEVR